jgi:hypothetical protein|tara:strand:+ start:1297 stop:1533 length:237 start_codon:yes stop_codon:yes gene_type:complete
MDIDAVIIEVEFQLESDYQPFGHFVCLRFVDQLPNRNKLNSIIKDMSKFPDVRVVDYNYIVKPIDETTDMTGLEITKH